jgi:hypothetical protein
MYHGFVALGAERLTRLKSFPLPFRAVLVLVAYHPGPREVACLKTGLDELSDQIRYIIVSNDHISGEPVEELSENALIFLANNHNPGYGRAVNQAAAELAAHGIEPLYLASLNTDLSWQPGSLENLVDWLDQNPDVVLAVPEIRSPEGDIQMLCKQNPTILALLSRRFLPEKLKPLWLRRYDYWYTMNDADYSQVFESPYLSGCCMFMRYTAFLKLGGFDERFFLYLEDADMSRRMTELGRSVHLPVSTIYHHWGRGNHRSKRLTLVNLHSAWMYFRKWGFRLI